MLGAFLVGVVGVLVGGPGAGAGLGSIRGSAITGAAGGSGAGAGSGLGPASFRWWGHSSSCPWRALARVVPSAGGGPFRRTGVRFCCKGPVSAGTRRRNRWCSGFFSAVDTGRRLLCNRPGRAPARMSLGGPGCSSRVVCGCAHWRRHGFCCVPRVPRAPRRWSARRAPSACGARGAGERMPLRRRASSVPRGRT